MENKDSDWAPYPWIDDGIYDYTDDKTRYTIKNHWAVYVISKQWLDKGGPEGDLPEFKDPWGSYPDFPPKPPKNK